MIDLLVSFLSKIFELQPFFYFFAVLASLCILLLIKRIIQW